MAVERVSAPVRPRAATWGEPADRQALQQIADDLAGRAGFRVCAIEVLRADGMLEFVAISGSVEASERLLGQGSPLDVMEAAFTCGATFGSLLFVAGEWMSEDASVVLSDYGYVPDLPPSEDPHAWRAEDMLVARLDDEAGHLRAVLYLDEPLDGRRPRPEEFLALSESLQLAFRAVLTTVEREAFGQQVRLAQAARTLIRSASGRLDLDELLQLATEELREAFRASKLEIIVMDGTHHQAGDPRVTAALRRELGEAMHRAWRHERVVIVEAGQVWGDVALLDGHVGELTHFLETLRVGTLVLVPVGAAGQLLGTLTIHRAPEAVRWTDSESSAALDVGRDLAAAILKAQAFAREKQLNAELRRLDDYRQELIWTVSHELKNPIGVVLGHLEMLEAEVTLSPRGQASLEAIGRGAARLQALAGDLLTLSRLGAAQEPRRLPVDLGALLEEVVEGEAVAATAQDIGIKVSVEGDPGVLGDPDDLRCVISNLVSNAVKYSDDGGTVCLSVAPAQEGVLFTCEDDGLGVSEADLPLLFTEFFRSTNSVALSRPGTGLGLPIVQRVVDRHGGRIEVESVLGEGTTFKVWLPTAR